MKTSLLMGDGKIDEEVVGMMKGYTNGSPIRWAAYQNHDMGHNLIGHLRFLAIGPNCTLKEAPSRYPDTASVIGWRYCFVGWADLDNGKVIEE